MKTALLVLIVFGVWGWLYEMAVSTFGTGSF